MLTGVGSTYQTGNAGISQIVSADYTGSTIINNNPYGGLIAYAGAGGNALIGQGQINVFQTSDLGNDVILFDDQLTDQQVNYLTSYGNDYVSIYGSPFGNQTNVIQTVGNGTDQISLADDTDLTFINTSAATSAIVLGNGSNLLLSGTGTSIVYASAGAGQITIAASGVALSQAVDIIAGFTPDTAINLAGFSGYQASVVNGSTVLTLSDNTQLVFAGIGDPSYVTRNIAT